jgi:hypothetical protein
MKSLRIQGEFYILFTDDQDEKQEKNGMLELQNKQKQLMESKESIKLSRNRI